MKKIITMLLAASCFSTLLPMNFALAEENIMIYVCYIVFNSEQHWKVDASDCTFACSGIGSLPCC